MRDRLGLEVVALLPGLLHPLGGQLLALPLGGPLTLPRATVLVTSTVITLLLRPEVRRSKGTRSHDMSKRYKTV